MDKHTSKNPLYRKVNSRARGVRHHFGGDFKHSANKKSETVEQVKGTMFGKKLRGLDYTPLYKFLLSKAGSNWNDVFSEAKSRLDKTGPIFYMVALNPADKQDYVRMGENTFFSGMYVDDAGILRLCNPALQAKDFTAFCTCCTHTFNGEVFGAIK